jgi:hypothetical protein
MRLDVSTPILKRSDKLANDQSVCGVENDMLQATKYGEGVFV